MQHDPFENGFIAPQQQEINWAKSLHDCICPEMLGTFMMAQQLLNDIPEEESDLWYQVKLLCQYSQKSFEQLRQMSHCLDWKWTHLNSIELIKIKFT